MSIGLTILLFYNLKLKSVLKYFTSFFAMVSSTTVAFCYIKAKTILDLMTNSCHYFAPGRVAQYCNERVYFCVFACISQKPHCPNLANCRCMLAVAMLQFYTDNSLLRFLLPVLWMMFLPKAILVSNVYNTQCDGCITSCDTKM